MGEGCCHFLYVIKKLTKIVSFLGGNEDTDNNSMPLFLSHKFGIIALLQYGLNLKYHVVLHCFMLNYKILYIFYIAQISIENIIT